MSKNERMVGISRRTLVKSTAIGSLALAAGGFSLPFTLRSAAAAVQQAREKVVWGACSVNCGSRCALRLHVKDNEVTWWKLTIPAAMSTATIRYAPVCAVAPSAGVLIIPIA